MSLEIERKFLVVDDSWRAAVRESVPLCQGYLNDERDCSVRVRISGQRAWLNLKASRWAQNATSLSMKFPSMTPGRC